MAETIKGIRTADGIAQIDYSALANTPVLVNDNLIDNADFSINQRKQTTYTGAVTGIDRWKSQSSAVTVTKISEGITINATSSLSSGYRAYEQTLGEMAVLKGIPLTLSIFVKECSGAWRMFFGSKGTSANRVTSSSFNTSGVYTVTGTLNADISDFAVSIVKMTNEDASITIAGMKLEVGTVQTLAYKGAAGTWIKNEVTVNPTLELEKCRRHLLVLNADGKTYASVGSGTATGTTFSYIDVPLTASMRTAPTVTYTGDWRIRHGGTNMTVTKIDVFKLTENIVTLRAYADGIVAGNAYTLLNTTDTTAKIMLSAEF